MISLFADLDFTVLFIDIQMIENKKIWFLIKSNFLILLSILLSVIFSVSCKKQSAQLPSNKVIAVDSTQLKLLDYNKEIIQQEDSAIIAFLAGQSEHYTRTNSGIWYTLIKESDNKLSANSSVTFTYKAFDVEGNLIMQEENKSIRFGKKEVVPGLEEGLKIIAKGDVARIIVPWYLAYGAQGYDNVKPYTTLIYDVKISK